MLKKQALDFIKRHPGGTFEFRDLVRELDVEADQKKELRSILEELAEQDLILKIKRGQYAIPARTQVVTGKLAGHRLGYGFVTPEKESGLREDVFIPAKHMRDAAHGDTVMIKVERSRKKGNKLEGAILKVVERANEKIVGKFYSAYKGGYVIPLDERYLHEVQVRELTGDVKRKLKDGMIVDVEITMQPGKGHGPVGRIVEVLGRPDDPGIEYKIVLRKYGISEEFSPDVLEEARSIVPEVRAADIAGRVDFRDRLTVTIDGETARDFDDAITLEKLRNGHYQLGVHIADVSHYVREDRALDREAYQRGTSVYFPDRAVPMLPHELSNGICSLNPRVDRLTLSVLMEVDPKGEVVHRQFVQGVINSNERMTYTSVKKILVDRDPAEIKKYEYLVDTFYLMQALCLILNEKRRQRGAIDFDLAEPEVVFNADGSVRDIVRSERNVAHRIIEEFMLLANETVATYLFESEIPSLYRIHEEPDPKKTKEFAELAATFGYRLQGKEGKYRARDFQRLADELSGNKEAQFLNYLMLRSFMQARYSEQNVGHFGLASETYTHFTSPIRRYPDLVVHRILKEAIRKTPDREKLQAQLLALPTIAEHSSERERNADAAEREIIDIKRAEFMADKLGEEYQGFITSVTSYGFYLEIFEHFVEGFVPVSVLLDDYYLFDERRHMLVGKHRKKSFQLGNKLTVRVDRVDRERHRIYFSTV
jgi:ribonuclease R